MQSRIDFEKTFRDIKENKITFAEAMQSLQEQVNKRPLQTNIMSTHTVDDSGVGFWQAAIAVDDENLLNQLVEYQKELTKSPTTKLFVENPNNREEWRDIIARAVEQSKPNAFRYFLKHLPRGIPDYQQPVYLVQQLANCIRAFNLNLVKVWFENTPADKASILNVFANEVENFFNTSVEKAYAEIAPGVRLTLAKENKAKSNIDTFKQIIRLLVSNGWDFSKSNLRRKAITNKDSGMVTFIETECNWTADKESVSADATKADASHEVKETVATNKADEIRDRVNRGMQTWAEIDEDLLRAATKQGDVEAIDFFVQTEELDVNKADQYGNTPLHYAISLGKMESIPTIQALLKNGADPTLKNKTGATPLMLSHGKEPADISKYLILAEIHHKVRHEPLNEQIKALLVADLEQGSGSSLVAVTHAPPLHNSLLLWQRTALDKAAFDVDEMRKILSKDIERLPIVSDYINHHVLTDYREHLCQSIQQEREKTFFDGDVRTSLTQDEQDQKNKPLKSKEDIERALKIYISRIEGYQKENDPRGIDFTKDVWFPFFKNSQAQNRRANYRLARDLLAELQAGGDIRDVFNSDNIKRLRSDYHPTRDIHSADLNRVIRAANQMIRTQAGAKLKK